MFARDTLTKLKELIRKAFISLGYNLYRLTENERQKLLQEAQSIKLWPDIEVSLSKLNDLRDRYSKVKLPVTDHSVWQTRGTLGDNADLGGLSIDIKRFRGNNSYVFSYLRNDPIVANLTYFIFANAVRNVDSAGLLGKLEEDGAFGCETKEYEGIGKVSRDLLDSILEINFLQRHLNILEKEGTRVLDIGAGYGRMAQRLLSASPAITNYVCVDAVPESTYVCETYLNFRGLLDRAKVIPLDQIEAELPRQGGFDLALNTHSFSECTYAAIEWWIHQVAMLKIRHFMIIPNDPEGLLSMEADRTRRDYLPLLEKLGYRLIVKEPVFQDPALQDVLSVHDKIYLFEQSASLE